MLAANKSTMNEYIELADSMEHWNPIFVKEIQD